MFNKRMVLFCIVLIVLAVTLQTVTGILGSAFAFVLIPSGLPVYIAARLNWILGIVIFSIASALSFYIDISNALFFICISGIIGLTLGITKNCFRHIFTIPIPSVLIVFIMLYSVNYFFGISVFGDSDIVTLFPKAFSLISILYLYCFMYLKLFMLAENLLHRSMDLNSY